MKKIIQILVITILSAILVLIIVLVFNPFNLRTKLIGGLINSYLSNNIENYVPIDADQEDSDGTPTGEAQTGALPDDKHPLLNKDQEEKLESFGVNVEQLPSSITPGMEECFVEKLGQARTDEIAGGDTPSALEFFKAKDCIGK